MSLFCHLLKHHTESPHQSAGTHHTGDRISLTEINRINTWHYAFFVLCSSSICPSVYLCVNLKSHCQNQLYYWILTNCTFFWFTKKHLLSPTLSRSEQGLSREQTAGGCWWICAVTWREWRTAFVSTLSLHYLTPQSNLKKGDSGWIHKHNTDQSPFFYHLQLLLRPVFFTLTVVKSTHIHSWLHSTNINNRCEESSCDTQAHHIQYIEY